MSSPGFEPPPSAPSGGSGSARGLGSTAAVRATLRAAGERLLFDLVLPVVGYALVARVMLASVWEGRATGAPIGLYSGATDHQGTLWFYWWLGKWWRDGESLLLTHHLCAPEGQFLRTNYPNRIDAWLAQPLLAAFEPPVALSLFVLGLTVLAGLSAFALLRQFTDDRPAAWLGGLPFAFQLYFSYEVAQGRPVTAMLAPSAAFLAAFAWSLHARGKVLPVVATLVSGALAGLAAEAYLPHAPYLGGIAALLAVGRVAWPAQGVTRWRPFVAAPAAVVCAILLAGPYLYEVLVLRRFAPRSPSAPDAALYAEPVYDLGLWPALTRRVGEDLSAGSTFQAGPVMSSMGFDAPTERGPWYRSVQAESLPWDWPWASSVGRVQRLVGLGSVWLVGGLLLGLAGRTRGVVFLLLAGLCYVLSLGPAVMTSVAPRTITYVLDGGEPIALPARWILDLAPSGRMFVRPYRLAPFVHLFLGGALALGLATLAGRGGDRRAWARRVLVLAAGAGFATAALGQVRAHPAFPLRNLPWAPTPFLAQMAADGEDYAIVELPMGIGPRRAGAQTVHGKRRSEPMMEVHPTARDRRPPVDCYDLPLLDGLWNVGLPGGEATVAARLTPDARAEARGAGFRYVVVWLELLHEDRRLGDPRFPATVLSTLDARLGPRFYEDDQVVVYAI